MKKFIYSLLGGAMALCSTSCMEVDNFDEPEGHYYGTIIDSTTGLPILASQGECKIRMWEMSYSLDPSPKDIPLKQDGTFNNTKIFNGTYDIQPRGAWWPVEKHRVPVGRNTPPDVMEVTPYLHIIDFGMELEYDGDSPFLKLSCRLEAPITTDMPNLRMVRPFLSLTQFCGSNQCIGEYDQEEYKHETNMAWNRVPKEDDGNSAPYEFRLPVKKGYTYFVRMGAQVNDEFRNYNYSEIKMIEIPM